MPNVEPYEDILRYWSGGSELRAEDLGGRLRFWRIPDRFSVDPAVDAQIRSRFGGLIEAASVAQLSRWEPIPRGRLALILLLDQFRRNVFRGTKDAFASDNIALALCRRGIELGMDRNLPILERAFFYMPMQHAEKLSAQELSLETFGKLTEESPDDMRSYVAEFLASAKTHRAIIACFGRFPHRNALLNRDSTAAETAYLLSEKIPSKK